MRLGWAAFELGMELTGHKEAAGRVLHNLNKVEFRIDARHNQSSRSNRVAVTVVELVAVTVALNNVVSAVGHSGAGACNRFFIADGGKWREFFSANDADFPILPYPVNSINKPPR